MNNFVNRNIQKECQSLNKNDYIGLINLVQSIYPNLYPKPNSLLYKLAVKQFIKINSNNKERMPIPKWVCGNLSENENVEELDLDKKYDFPIKRELELIDDFDNLIEEAKEFLYMPDNCLYETSSLPGSVGYTLCDLLKKDEYDINTIDWANSFYPITQIAAIITAAHAEAEKNMKLPKQKKSFWEKVGNFFGDIGEFFSDIGNYIGNYIGGDIIKYPKDVVNKLVDFVGDVGNAISDGFNSIKKIF